VGFQNLKIVFDSQNKQQIFYCTTLTPWGMLWGPPSVSCRVGFQNVKIVYGSQNKQQIFYCTPLTPWCL